ncbi:MAG: hypothetical protein U0T81_14435 [Saprospiraceae bacterium]
MALIKPATTGGYSYFFFNPQGNWNGTKISLRILAPKDRECPVINQSIISAFRCRYAWWRRQVFLTATRSLQVYFDAQDQYRLPDDLSSNYVDYNTLNAANGTLAAALGNKINAPGGSQRGNPVDNDWYQSVSVQLVYHLLPQRRSHEHLSQKITGIAQVEVQSPTNASTHTPRYTSKVLGIQ